DAYRYAEQTEQKGTGHAVLTAEPFLNREADSVVVVYGDQPFVTPQTIKSLALPLSVGVKLILATAIITNDDLFEKQFSLFGRIVRDEQGHITKIVEAKDASPEELLIREVNVGFMALDRAWAFEHLRNLKND